MRNLLIEISAVDPAYPGTPVTLRASTASPESSGVNLDNKEWAPVIIGGPEFDYSYWAEGQPQGLDTSYGNVTFLLDPVSGSNVWPKYSFEGANATIWVGAFGDAFGAYRKIWSGKLGPLVRDSDQQAHIPLLGAEADLVRDLLSATYAGTGGVEGGSALRGAWKPYSVGECINVAPVLVDAAKWVYQVNAYDPTPINAIYEAALGVEIMATVGSYAELVALDIPDGKAAACPSLGLFRLKNEPAGKITADIGSPATVGTVAASLMGKAGLSGSRIDASVTATPRAYSLYIVDQTSILDAIRDAAFAGSRFMLADSSGVFCFVPIVSNKAAGVLSSKRDARPLVQPDKIVQEPTALPAYRVRIGHTRVWAVHSTNEISPSIAELAADQAALEAAAQAAQQTADYAKAQADLAVGYYNAMVADGILDRTEKRGVVERFEGYTAERTGLLAQASAQGITTERTAYANAYTALNTYLTGLSPAYNNTALDTPINADDFRAAFVNYDVAKQNLVNALANKAAQTAGWTNVSGRPTNLAGLDPDASGKLGGIEAGATVGAPVGTNVGGVPAQDVARSITNFNARNDRNSSPIRSVKMVAGEDLNHTLNKDGSMNLVVRWEWDGNPDDIDGFLITVRQGQAGSGRTGLNSVAQSIFRSR